MPKNKNQFIDYARSRPEATQKENYLIGENSIPHITLCHFYFDATKISQVWQKVKEQGLDLIQMDLVLAEICSTIHADACWFFLVPQSI